MVLSTPREAIQHRAWSYDSNNRILELREVRISRINYEAEHLLFSTPVKLLVRELHGLSLAKSRIVDSALK